MTIRKAGIYPGMPANHASNSAELSGDDRRHPPLFLRFLCSGSVFHKRARIGGLLIFLLLVSACASTGTRISTGSADEIWQMHRLQLNRLDHWELKGRIGFVSEHESGSASLYWKQNGDSYELKIVAPLGMGSLVVAGNNNGVTLQSSDGEMLYAEDAQQLVWQRTGWVIPMGSLRYWILGLPLENEVYRLDESGHISHIKNESWQVEYQRYQTVQSYELPRNLQIHNPDLKIKLVIKDWQL
jgi:outer membrane lipoprotein LolB